MSVEKDHIVPEKGMGLFGWTLIVLSIFSGIVAIIFGLLVGLGGFGFSATLHSAFEQYMLQTMSFIVGGTVTNLFTLAAYYTAAAFEDEKPHRPQGNWLPLEARITLLTEPVALIACFAIGSLYQQGLPASMDGSTKLVHYYTVIHTLNAIYLSIIKMPMLALSRKGIDVSPARYERWWSVLGVLAVAASLFSVVTLLRMSGYIGWISGAALYRACLSSLYLWGASIIGPRLIILVLAHVPHFRKKIWRLEYNNWRLLTSIGRDTATILIVGLIGSVIATILAQDASMWFTTTWHAYQGTPGFNQGQNVVLVSGIEWFSDTAGYLSMLITKGIFIVVLVQVWLFLRKKLARK